MRKSTAIMLGAAAAVIAGDVSFTSPLSWGTARSTKLVASFTADSSLIGRSIQLTLTENKNGTENSVSTKKHLISAQANDVSFSLPEGTIGGKEYLALKWKLGEMTGIVSPFGVAPITAVTPTETVAKKLNAEPTVQSVLNNGTAVSLAENAKVGFAWTPNSLAIAISGKSVVELLFDLDNSKGAFVAFSDRKITADASGKKVTFTYLSRKAKDNRIVYTSESWGGDMKSTVTDDGVLITVPWYDLGLKPFEGRKIGITIQSGTAQFPLGASADIPATWANLLLR